MVPGHSLLSSSLPAVSFPSSPDLSSGPALGWPRASLGLELTCPVVKFSRLRALGLLYFSSLL